MATEHNPEEKTLPFPIYASPFCPLPQKRAIHFNPYRHLGYVFLRLSSRFSVAEDTLSSCQAFPQLIVPGLMALCHLDPQTGN